jgi:hypothetical protein
MILCATATAVMAQRPGTPVIQQLPQATQNYSNEEPGPIGCRQYRTPVSSVGDEMTRLSGTAACMPPPTPCGKAWNDSVSADFYPANGTKQLLRDYPEVMVNSTQQRAIIAAARSYAATPSMIPAGKQFFRINFFSQKAGTGMHPQWRVWARAFYGRCGTPN